MEDLAPMKGAAVFAIGFVMANASMFGRITPFGVALAAGAPAELSWFGALGAICGYLLPLGPAKGMKYVAAVLAVAIVRSFLKKRTSLAAKSWLNPSLVFALLLIPSALSAYALGGALPELLLALAEALLAAGMAYLVARGAKPLTQGFVASVLERQEQVGLVAVLSILLLALCGITSFGFSLGRFAAVLAVLAIALGYGPSVACAAGVIAGAVAGLAQTNQIALAGIYGFAALFAGLFAVFGRFGTAAAFVVGNGLMIIVMGTEVIPITVLYEVMAATFLFMVLPRRILNAAVTFRLQKPDTEEGFLGQELYARLSLASGVIREVRSAVESVSQRLNKINADDITTVYDTAADSICSRCVKRHVCWGDYYTRTMDAFSTLGPALREKGVIAEVDFPRLFLESCDKPRRIAAAINEAYERFRTRESATRRFAELRAVVSGQFEAMSELLDELGEEATRRRTRHARLSGAVRDYLESTGIYPREATCETDGDDRLTVTLVIATDEIESISRVLLARVLGRVCKRRLSLPLVSEKDGLTTIRLKEQPRFAPIYGESQSAFRDGKLCGDSIRYLSEGGKVQVVLSDGMGSGPAAAVDSAMTASLLSRMMSAGLKPGGALRFANAALITKSAEESLATADIAVVDLYTGRAELFKAGAAPTFVRNGARAFMLEGDSLPIGILNGISVDHTHVELAEGDILLMVSDGAAFDGGQWIVRELETHAGEDMSALTKRIIAAAKERRTDGHEDDISAAALLLRAPVEMN